MSLTGSLADQASGLRTPAAATPVEAPGFAFDAAVVGLGYVGLPTALALHFAGLRVVGVDVSQARLDAIVAGDVDLIEADRGRLSAALLAPDSFALSDAP